MTQDSISKVLRTEVRLNDSFSDAFLNEQNKQKLILGVMCNCYLPKILSEIKEAKAIVLTKNKCLPFMKFLYERVNSYRNL